MYHPSSQPEFTENTVSSNIGYSKNLLIRSCMQKILEGIFTASVQKRFLVLGKEFPVTKIFLKYYMLQ
jgi:hypothetical protein